MVSITGDFIVAIVAAGMGASFVWADSKSPTSRALGAALFALSIAMFLNVPHNLRYLADQQMLWGRMFSLAEGAAIVSFEEWALRISRTEADASSGSRSVEGWMRLGQGLAIFYGMAGAIFPTMREFGFFRAHQPDALLNPVYYMFAVPLYLSLGLTFVSVAAILRARPDRSERIRLSGLLVATPFLMSGIFRPQWRPIMTAIGEMIFLAGAVRYHVIQGERAQFMGRFLAPEVGKLVRERGLSAATQQTRVEISIVACDLRGFTPFSEVAAPEEVMQLMRDYYAAIGEAVTEFGGTIESFAGDGIVSLVGTPLAYPDHARRAVTMSLSMIERSIAVLAEWRKTGLELGIGVGVATGYVTVGVIGGAARLEYVAVGPSLNLASRLCDRARSGQVLADQRTVSMLEDSDAEYRLEALDAAELKGFSRPMKMFEVKAAVAESKA